MTDPSPPSPTMRAMVTMGHGDLDQIVWREDWPRPTPATGEVLIRVGACGLNNTDVNTRSGWYSKAVTEATTGGAYATVGAEDPSWGAAPIAFPRIQGADICGRIEAVGDGVDPARIGERVISDNWLRDPAAPDDLTRMGYVGSECDGGFAEYTTLPAQNAVAVNSPLSDADLATFPCAYATAEGMLTRAGVDARDTVLIPGASGGVGGALVQLAKLRRARVIALASPAKHPAVAALGADRVLPRGADGLTEALQGERITVLADVVGGPDWPALLDVIARGGRYVCSGAIAGPMVTLDLRTLYLRDLTFHGSTVTPPETLARVVALIEAGHLRPNRAATYPLCELHAAQRAFIDKAHTGNIVVEP
ncbi:MAG: alcohol dehydrogenase family protein [Shimia sp.]